MQKSDEQVKQELCETPEEKKDREDFHNSLDEMKKEYIRHIPDLVINRVPKKYLQRFLVLAKEEFADDYGMVIRELVRIHDGIYIDQNEEINMKIEVLATEIEDIKRKLSAQKEETNVKVMADGTMKKIG